MTDLRVSFISTNPKTLKLLGKCLSMEKKIMSGIVELNMLAKFIMNTDWSYLSEQSPQIGTTAVLFAKI